MARTIVIGDIHGALKALTQLLERIGIQKEDTFIFLGDYVDGWSQSGELIAFLMDFQQQYNCIFIKGNHDAWCEEWLATGKADSKWLKHGGESTVKSYKTAVANKAAHLEFFNRMKNYHEDEHKRLFIHAGFSSMHGPEHEHYQSNFTWDRTLWEVARTMNKRIKKDSKLYPKRLLLYNEIYIGHTPTLHYDIKHPMNCCNVWNVDTGAAFYGPLSAIDADSKQIWQSDIVKQLYPSEKGRN